MRGRRARGRPKGSKRDIHREAILGRIAEKDDIPHRRTPGEAGRRARGERRRRHGLDLPRSLRPDIRKETAQASEQDRPDVASKREAWVDGQPELDPARLIVIDETWASAHMARRRGRSMKGERLRSGVPHGRWKTTPFVAGLRLTGIAAPCVPDGPIDRSPFETYVAKALVPELAPGVVVMDNLSSHKGSKVRESER